MMLRLFALAGLALAAPARAASHGYAPVNGLQLYYEVHGKAAQGAVPLVLLHGGGSTIATSFGKPATDHLAMTRSAAAVAPMVEAFLRQLPR